MTSQTIELPWPLKGLSPNARLHWSSKSRIAKLYRRDCFLRARAALLVAPDSERIRLDIVFVPNDKRKRDDDNLIAAFKSGRDGLADAMGIDDSRFVTRFSLSDEIRRGGVVIVTISGDDENEAR